MSKATPRVLAISAALACSGPQPAPANGTNATSTALAKAESLPPPTRSAAAPGSAPLAGLLEEIAAAPPFAFEDAGTSYPMKHGSVVRVGSAIEVRLASDKDPGCGPAPRGEQAYFRFTVPAGPGRRFFAGAPFGTSAQAGLAGGTMYGLGAAHLSFLIEPFHLAPGVTVRGLVRTIRWGAGRFEAKVCPGVHADGLHALPEVAPSTPLSGRLGASPFAVQSAVAVLDHQGDTVMISYIDLFATPGVDCTNHRLRRSADRIRITDLGGASSDLNLHGSPQPASAWFSLASDASGQGHHPMEGCAAWVRLDHLTFTSGERISGAAVVETSEAVKPPDRMAVAGHFEAMVCER